VENAILHGFENSAGPHALRVGICREEDRLRVEIMDNGCGIRDDIVEEMNNGSFRQTKDKNHIGMENAITRIRMYYGEDAEVWLESELKRGTTVHIRIPLLEGGAPA